MKKIDLSEYEKRVYVALLRIGRSKSREISKEGGVSYGRIYEILDKLESKGLISIQPTSPKTFDAIEPRVAFNLFFERKRNELNDLERVSKKLVVPVKKKVSCEKDVTLILHGKEKQLEMVRAMGDRAKNEILAIPGVYRPKVANKIATQKSLKRGVKSKRILREISKYNQNVVKENIALGESVRMKELPGLRLKVVDGKEAIISIVDPKTKERISIYTANKDFAKSMVIFFNSLWETSEKVKL